MTLVGVFLLGAGVSLAQQDAKLDLKTTAEKEIRFLKDGKMVLERLPAEKTTPGDVLVYTIDYRNAGRIAVEDAVIVDPLPRGIVYLANTAEGQDADVTYSIDNSRSWHKPPIMMPVKKADGSVESKPVSTERYTHIRWVIKKPVQPGQSGRVQFRATVK